MQLFFVFKKIMIDHCYAYKSSNRWITTRALHYQTKALHKHYLKLLIKKYSYFYTRTTDSVGTA